MLINIIIFANLWPLSTVKFCFFHRELNSKVDCVSSCGWQPVKEKKTEFKSSATWSYRKMIKHGVQIRCLENKNMIDFNNYGEWLSRILLTRMGTGPKDAVCLSKSASSSDQIYFEEEKYHFAMVFFSSALQISHQLLMGEFFCHIYFLPK